MKRGERKHFLFPGLSLGANLPCPIIADVLYTEYEIIFFISITIVTIITLATGLFTKSNAPVALPSGSSSLGLLEDPFPGHPMTSGGSGPKDGGKFLPKIDMQMKKFLLNFSRGKRKTGKYS